MYYKKNSCRVRDVVFSKASELSQKLVFDLASDERGFMISFIINSSLDVLKQISDAAEKINANEVEIWFSERSNLQENPKMIPQSRLEYKNFAGCSIEVNGHTAPYLQYANCPPIYYVSVIFNTYEKQ